MIHTFKMMALILVSCFCFNRAEAQQPTLVNVGLQTAFIPIGFDGVNTVQFTVEGSFLTTCYRVGPSNTVVNKFTITVNQTAYLYPGECGKIVTKFSRVVEMGILAVGTYSVVDGSSGRVLGSLPVATPPNKSPTTFPDDYLYAPLTDASLLNNNGAPSIVLSGVFTDNCTQFSDVRTQINGNVIQVLPITQRTATCSSASVPFQNNLAVNVPKGHYLLYVRSLSGNSISKIVDVY